MLFRSNEITITGKNTNETLTVKLDWVDSGVAKYRADMWGMNSICVTLYDIGAGKWMTTEEIEAVVDENTSFQFKLNASILDFIITSWENDTNSGTIWDDAVSIAGRGLVKFGLADSTQTSPLNGKYIKADCMNGKIAGDAKFGFINNTDLDITWWNVSIGTAPSDGGN